MKKRLLSFVILLMMATPLWASHIVGGEFELRHLEGLSVRTDADSVL